MTLELSKLLEALYMACNDTQSYYNKSTGHIEWDVDFDPRFHTDNYVHVPDRWQINEDAMIIDFIHEQKPEYAERLDMAFHGTGAHARFRTALYQCSLEQKWFDKRLSNYLKLAEDWCAKNGIELIRDQEG